MKNKILITLICLLNCLCLVSFGAAEPFSAPTDSPNGEESQAEPQTLDTANNTVSNMQPDAALTIEAKAGALMDLNTGTLLFGKNEHERLYPASVTKIMTLLLIAQAIKENKLTLTQKITCSETAAAKGGSQIWLEKGEVMTVDELLKASFVYSANDACTLLAETLAGSEEAFVDLMNKKAEELNMSDTHFDNCTGLDDDTTTHLTSAYDIAIMARELMKYDFVTNYTKIWMDELRNGETQLVNTNKLIRTYQGATGLKTGTTSKAGCCIAATAERNGLKLVAVVLGAEHSKQRFAAAKALLDYGFAGFEIFTPKPVLKDITELPVRLGVTHSVPLVMEQPQPVLLKKGEASQVTEQQSISEELNAPVEKGSVVGKTEYILNGVTIASVNIVCGENVEALRFQTALLRVFQSISTKKIFIK